MKYTIKEKQNEMLKMLKMIKNICEKNDIEFSLAYGSTLGAIRHGGFIPWDDDADITMHWNDYIKFTEAWEKTSYDGYELLSFQTKKKYPFLHPRIINKNKKLNEKIMENIDIEYGIWIDIFPLIKRGKDYKTQKKQLRLLKYGNFLQHKYYYLSSNNYVKKYHKFILIKRIFFRLLIDSVCFKLSKHFIYKAIDMGNSDECFDMEYNNRIYDNGIFNNLVYMKFEDTDMPIPSQYEEYLEKEYGDWRTPVKYNHENDLVES